MKRTNGITWKCRKCGARYLPPDRAKHYKKCPGRNKSVVGSDGKTDSTHYGGADNPHETIKCLAAWGLENDALCWNTAKYVSRAGKKAGATLLRDLEKAHYYLGKRIEGLKKEIVENAEAR